MSGKHGARSHAHSAGPAGTSSSQEPPATRVLSRALSFALALVVAVGLTGVIGVGAASAGKPIAGSFDGSATPDGAFQGVAGVAVDQATHDVLVVDPGAGHVDRFDAQGNYLSQFGAFGSGPGELASPNQIAIAPDGSIYVADTANNRIEKFTAAGVFVDELGEAGSGLGELSSPTGVAVGPDGSVYAADFANFRIVKFDGASGGFQSLIAEPGSGAGELAFLARVAVDSTGRVYAIGTDPISSQSVIKRYDSSGAFTDVLVGVGTPLSTGQGPAELTIDRTDNHIFVAAGAADASEQQVLELNPDGTIADVHGEGNAFAFQAAGVAVSDGGGPIYVSNANAGNVFILDNRAPTVTSPGVAALTRTSVRLQAQVNPFGLPTSYHFEYGAADCASSACATQPIPDASAGDGQRTLSVAKLVSGLSPATLYHSRLVATNARGTTAGPDVSFRTLPLDTPPAGETRTYERVSPEDKGGAGIDFDGPAQAAVSGDAVTYRSLGSFAQDSSAVVYNQLLSRRTTTGWTTTGINAPVDPYDGVGAFLSTYQGFSADLSKGVAWSWAFRDYGGAQMFNIFRRDNTTGAFDLLSRPASPLPPQNPAVTSTTASTLFGGASADFTHVVFQSNRALTADAPPEAGTQPRVYEWVGGEVRLVSVLPDGTSIAGMSFPGGGEGQLNLFVGGHPVSADGQRIFFTGAALGPQQGPLYVREHGAQTLPVSVDERAGSPPAGTTVPAAAKFQFATVDGSAAFFISDVRLTDDASASGPDLYRWIADAPSGHHITDLTTANPAGAQVLGSVGAAADGSRLYFVATGVLDTGAVDGEPNLYLWDQATGVKLIATLAFADVGVWATDLSSQGTTNGYRSARVTPDGRHVLFASSNRLTGYDNAGHAQLYLYDADHAGLTCVSCNPRGAAATADVGLVNARAGRFPQARLTDNLADDGSRVFFNSTEALVGADTNAKQDVYEWSAGSLRLVSTGKSADASNFVDASPSGDDVFFTTRQQLTGSDRDDVVDLYDARVGGGFPDQPPASDCFGDVCQGPATAAANLPSAASITFTGAGNAVPATPVAPAARVAVSKTRAVRGVRGVLSVKVTGNGSLTVSGVRVKTVTRITTRAATYHIKVALTPAGIRLLAKRKTVRTRVRVVFKRPGTQTVTAVVSLTFRTASTSKGR
ncbi:MAG TPA: NHL repeat-containing protein [Solirubrobacteraceae bacterium]|nr:NHL repeat-containing protein [Solirubrobacteraceae bacterium]